MSRQSVQARVEASAAGRAVISAFMVFVLAAIVVVNMPDSALKRGVGKVTNPFVNAAGLDQDWTVFSDPPTLSAYVEGRIEFRDGRSETVRIPSREGLGAYVDYRGQKFEERVRLDANQHLWQPYAVHLARQARARGLDPVRVTLVRRWAETLPPGDGPDRGEWQEYDFYTLTLDGVR